MEPDLRIARLKLSNVVFNKVPLTALLSDKGTVGGFFFPLFKEGQDSGFEPSTGRGACLNSCLGKARPRVRAGQSELKAPRTVHPTARLADDGSM